MLQYTLNNAVKFILSLQRGTDVSRIDSQGTK